MKNSMKQLIATATLATAALATSATAQAGYYTNSYTTYEPVIRHQTVYVPEHHCQYQYQYSPYGYHYQYNCSYR